MAAHTAEVSPSCSALCSYDQRRPSLPSKSRAGFCLEYEEVAGYVLWEGRLDASLLSFSCTQAQPDITRRFRPPKEACSLHYSSSLTATLATRRAASQPTAG